jgi:hypothetical protein
MREKMGTSLVPRGRDEVCGWAQDQIQALQAWEEVSSASRHYMPGYSYLIPPGSGQKPPETSIFDASRLEALNMNSPRQSLGRRTKKNKPEGLES